MILTLFFYLFCPLAGLTFHLSNIIIRFVITLLHLPHWWIRYEPFPCQMPPTEFGSGTHTHTHSWINRRHSVQLTPSHTWYFPQTPYNPPYTQYSLQPGEGPITPTGGNYPESPSCLEWYLQGLQVLSSHYVCSITCPPPLNTHQPPVFACLHNNPAHWPATFSLLTGSFVL